ncbi:MAG TPA: ABC transporter substrate-binding protein [Anaeromyxobacteraceae bacterium]|nr:ABC transporter substrate-binding protein [Anaeromyxobacteraceae bacterium]
MRGVAAALALAAPLAALAGLAPRYGGELSVALAGAPADLDPARISDPAELEAARALHATLVEWGPGGALRPGLLASLPEAEPGARAFRLRLRPGLRFQDGRPVTAGDVAASLARLLAPQTRSLHGWIALPVAGAEEVREGRASALSGAQVLGELELRLVLDAPFPDFPAALAALPSAILARGSQGSGAGPFRLASRGPDGALRLTAFDGHFRGRAYADGVNVLGADGRRAARAVGRGEVDLVLRPEAAAGATTRDLPQVTATYAVVNARRLGPAGDLIRRAIFELDRPELGRLAGRGRVSPLAALLPPSLLPQGAPPAARPAARIADTPRVSLVVADANRALADRLQVKLFDRGVRVAVEAVSRSALAARLASGNYDLAVVSLTFTSGSAQPALLEVAWALGGPSAARRALQRLGGSEPATVASELAEEIGAVPLFASGLRASARPGLYGLEVLPDATVDLAELWLPPRRTAQEGAR